MRYKVTALKTVESYIEATDITVAGCMATIECNRDKVTLVSVEPAGQAQDPVPAMTGYPALQALETTTDFELDRLDRLDGHW